MLKKLLPVLFIVLCSAGLSAQKTVHKIVEDPAITTVEIDASRVYKLTVSTVASSKIDIRVSMEGEYENDLVVDTRKTARHYTISTAFGPSFKHPNDKLSAHKVISVSMIVELPQHVSLIISGKNINVTISGNYNSIKTNTENGNINLTNVNGSGTIHNFGGDIFVHEYDGEIVASSKYGKVLGRNTQRESTVLTLKTVNGNIYIDKPK